VLRRRKEKSKKGEGVVKEIEEEAKKVERGVKKEAKKLEEAVERRTERKPRAAVARPTGHAPQAMVMARHGTGMIARPGRGFSLGELSGVGLAPRLAFRWGVMVDPRRRSVIQGNVDSLRGWSSHPGAVGRIETEARRVEEELVEVGKEAEREVAVAEKEAVKAAKAVKKEAKKVEKAAKKKVTRPKARPKKKKKS
jgi:ribosomal protein L13E